MEYTDVKLLHRVRGTTKYLHRYPKLLLLFITFILAYLIFNSRNYQPFQDFVVSLGYIGTFIAGALFAYGFTAAPATAILFIIAEHQNLVLAGLIGGFGALVGDLIIFSFIRYSIADEVKKLSRERIVRYVHNKTPNLIKRYLTPVVAGFIIASPLPDEIGVSLLAVSTHISLKIFSLISYVLNTGGIFAVLYLGKVI